MMRLPPRSDLALPIDATVMSSRWPGLAKGGRSAVTITTAAFFIAGLTFGGNCSPKREVDRLQRLHRIFEVVVARARQADDDAVAGELVRADALEPAQILDAVGARRSDPRGSGDQDREREEEMTDHGRRLASKMVTESFALSAVQQRRHQNGLTTEKKR